MIYLDHNATTPAMPEVIEACGAASRGLWGNPSSLHRAGQAARSAVERARRQVAGLIGASHRELTWTGGATEANGLAVTGYFERGGVLLTCAVEHPSLVGAAEAAVARAGVTWRLLPVDGLGRLELAALAEALEEAQGARVLVSVMLAQNEVGNLYPIAEVAAMAHAAGAKVHCDATQAVGRWPVDVGALGVDALSLSGHKFGGPRGVGALYMRRGYEVAAQQRGGHQERGRRAGTENVEGIVGLGVASARAADLSGWDRARGLTRVLWEGLRGLEGVRRLGDAEASVGTTCCATFDGVPADELLMALDLEGVAVSAGSACSSGSLEPSPVLLAMGIDEATAKRAVRFSLGPTNTAEEMARAASIVSEQVAHIRGVRGA